MADTSETPAEGAKGFLLYDPRNHGYFFRVYEATDKRRFVDYQLAAEDIAIEITGKHWSLYRGEKNRIGYSSQYLNKGDSQTRTPPSADDQTGK